ncbi:hypothetical protein OIU85_007773 [Salix viminalis]|uniref:R13L1/DRL21-like LRR repeat region domain-containing protein n=1 Tax=Salix viminalis TaxID=40686 RepID=A0A9Q0P9E9_SALVM|nr:hypothetical protein OIU85_007773 [Salix viminalis]
MSDEEIGDFLRRFQHLRDLSLLRGGKLPNSIGNLKQLWYLNLSGSSEHKLPKTLQNGSSIKELGELECLEGKLRIWMLQKVDDAQDALGANLEGMRDLKKLDLRWSGDAYVDLRLSECHCSSLPPLGQLAYLKRLVIKALDKVERVGCEFYGDCTSTNIPFNSLESLTFERMLQWCEWIPDVAKSDRDKSFPCLQVLCISECLKLKNILLSHLPSLKQLTITKCSQFVLSLPRPTTIKKMSLNGTLQMTILIIW